MKKISISIIISFIILGIYLMGYDDGYKKRDSQIESAIIRNWVEKYGDEVLK